MEIHLQPKQFCPFSLSRRFISTPKLSLEKFKWATDAQSWTNKTLHCFEEVLAFPHILNPTIKLPGTDNSFSAQYSAIWHHKKTDTRGSKSKEQKKLGGEKVNFYMSLYMNSAITGFRQLPKYLLVMAIFKLFNYFLPLLWIVLVLELGRIFCYFHLPPLWISSLYQECIALMQRQSTTPHSW